MTINLITGLPGNCKTLYTIAAIKDLSERENRPVFYSGIPELKLPWTEIDPQKWMECPPGSIVVIDECQRIYRNRTINTTPPEFVTALETHRHLGIDLYFITQHPLLIDPALRRLTGRHLHAVRKFGMQASTIHEWGQVRENCDKPVARRDSIKHHWKFDKSIYPLYKSAELHTVKANWPWHLKLLLVLPFVLAFLCWRIYASIHSHMADPAPASAPSSGVVPMMTAPGQPADGKASYVNAVADAKQFVYSHTPRIVGMEHTAPRYDELTRPTRVPVPAACISNAHRCTCYSQQGTRLDVTLAQCSDIIELGYFMSFDPDGKEGGGARESRMRDDAPKLVSTAQSSNVVTLGDGSGYGILGSGGRAHGGSKQ